MTDQRKAKARTQGEAYRLSPAQLYCLAWAARPDDSRPPDEIFGMVIRGRLTNPPIVRATWRALAQHHLVRFAPHGTYVATELGRALLLQQDLLESAMHVDPCTVGPDCRVCPNLTDG